MLEQEDNLDGQQEQLQEEKTLILRKAVALGGVVYESLDLREPTAMELSKASKAGGSVDIAIQLISIIAKVPVGAVGRLGQRDFQEAADFLSSFTPDGPQIGGM